MADMLPPKDVCKDAAARAAVALVEDGMRLGLGTGSTAALMVDHLALRVRQEGLRLRCAATSDATAKQAQAGGLIIEDLNDIAWLDMTIDGADEIDPDLNLIKGGGGALLREKITACASDRMVVIADSAKVVESLGAFPLPIEVIPFGWQTTRKLIEEALFQFDRDDRDVVLRRDHERPYRTDSGNLIVDIALGQIDTPRELSGVLNAIPGVVETGLFLNMCQHAIIGHHDGTVSDMLVEGGVA